MIFESALHDATHVPSGWKMAYLAQSTWSVKHCNGFLVRKSHTFTVVSSLEDTMILESGENWALRTQLVCATIDVLNLGTSLSYPLRWVSLKLHTLRVLSSEPDNKNSPDELKQTDLTGPEWLLMGLR